MLNTLLVFGISGLWHGANWTYIIWGLLHGLYIILEKPAQKYTNAIITFVFVSIAWVFFRAPNFTIARDILGALFSFSSFSTQQINLWTPLLALTLMFVLDLFYRKKRFDLVVDELSVMQRWGIYFFLIFVLLFFSGTQKFTFIYFQF